MQRKVVLFGAGKEGRAAAEKIGEDNIDFFIDNDVTKEGKFIGNIPVYSFFNGIKLINSQDVILTVSARYVAEIEEQLSEEGNIFFYSLNEYFKRQHFHLSKIIKYKNMFAAKRCFLIGSGPSLRIEDLEKLQQNKEICFGANKIFKIFNSTTWRPDLYCVTDRRMMIFYQERIERLILPNMLLAYYRDRKLQRFMEEINNHDNKQLFFMRDDLNIDNIAFSVDPMRFIFEGRTVMYAMIQWAVYMGFHDIFLLGVDFDYTDTSGYDKNKTDHFCKDYIEEGEEVLYSSQEYCLRAFEHAEKMSQKMGFNVYNATRGGKLEVFRRVNLDDFLK